MSATATERTGRIGRQRNRGCAPGGPAGIRDETSEETLPDGVTVPTEVTDVSGVSGVADVAAFSDVVSEVESAFEPLVGSAAERVVESRSALSTRLLTQAAAETDPLERKRLQDEVVVMHMGLARAIASRYRGRGIAEEDLAQAASMALLKAARNFDPGHGVEFLSYAVVTMKGEVKRQFRDFGWMVRPPRPIQKMQADVARAQGDLIQTLGRSPRVSEVAAHLAVAEEDVLEALSADGCFTPTSLDLPLGDQGASSLGDTIQHEDTALDEAEARVMLRPAVKALPERERQVLYLRFFRQMSQSQIAAEVGITQMQVSRILSRVLAQLRGRLADT